MRRVQIIVPVYNEAGILPLFYKETKAVVSGISGYSFGYIFVNDGSTDETAGILKDLSGKDSSVKYISFSRNFGKEAAISAGLIHSDADITILMDGDIQHPPSLIPEMLSAIEEGYQAAGARRRSGLMSRAFTGINNSLSNIKLEKGATDFMCMTREFLDALLLLTEKQRFSKGLFAWVGYEIKWLDYKQEKRLKGKSKWKAGSLFSYAADGLTSFSIVPLKIVALAGAVICILSVVYILITLIQTLIFGIDVPGYVTTLVAILFMGGATILAIGILGIYIGRIYIETKNRPLYIIKDSNLNDGNEKIKK